MHRNIEILIGRLITDEAFRQAFIRNPATAVAQFVASGYHVTELEAAALTSIDHAVWSRVADEIDPRLRKWSLVQD